MAGKTALPMRKKSMVKIIEIADNGHTYERSYEFLNDKEYAIVTEWLTKNGIDWREG